MEKIPWRRQWQPTPVFLPGKFHGQWRLGVCTLWGHKESDITEHTHTHTRACTHTHTQRDLQIKKSGEFSSDLLSFTLLIQRPQVNFEKGSLWNRKSLESKGGMNCFKGYEASQERLEMIIQLGKQYTVVPYPPQFLRASGAPGSLRPFATAYICGYVITTPRWQVAKF